MPVHFAGKKEEEEPGMMSRIYTGLRPALQNAVSGLEGEVSREGATSLLVSVPEGSEVEAEEAISKAVSDSLMDLIHDRNRVVEHGGAIISGGSYTPPVAE